MRAPELKITHWSLEFVPDVLAVWIRGYFAQFFLSDQAKNPAHKWGFVVCLDIKTRVLSPPPLSLSSFSSLSLLSFPIRFFSLASFSLRPSLCLFPLLLCIFCFLSLSLPLSFWLPPPPLSRMLEITSRFIITVSSLQQILKWQNKFFHGEPRIQWRGLTVTYLSVNGAVAEMGNVHQAQ